MTGNIKDWIKKKRQIASNMGIGGKIHFSRESVNIKRVEHEEIAIIVDFVQGIGRQGVS